MPLPQTKIPVTSTKLQRTLVHIREFLQQGKMGFIELGVTEDFLISKLGRPTSKRRVTRKRQYPVMYLYEPLELVFDDKCVLTNIYVQFELCEIRKRFSIGNRGTELKLGGLSRKTSLIEFQSYAEQNGISLELKPIYEGDIRFHTQSGVIVVFEEDTKTLHGFFYSASNQ